MQINLNYTYTKEDVFEAYRFIVFPTQSAKKQLVLFSVIILGMSSLFLFLSAPNNTDSEIIFKAGKTISEILIFFWLLMLMIIGSTYFLLPNYIFNKSDTVKGVFHLLINDEGLSYTQTITEENANKENKGSINWNYFTKKAESKGFIFLYQNRKTYILPKVAFKTIDELQQFKNFLNQQENIKVKKYRNKPLWNAQ